LTPSRQRQCGISFAGDGRRDRVVFCGGTELPRATLVGTDNFTGVNRGGSNFVDTHRQQRNEIFEGMPMIPSPVTDLTPWSVSKDAINVQLAAGDVFEA
jgi:hypothetical protein